MEIARDVFTWKQHSERLGYDLNGFWWCSDEHMVVVDPPEPTTLVREVLKKFRGEVLIVVTNHTHWRATDDIRSLSGGAVAMSAMDASTAQGEVDRILSPGERLPGEWVVLDMAGKTLGEIGLYRESGDGVLLLGDSLIGDPPGELRLLPDDKIADRTLLTASLERLAPLRYDTLLVGDGASIATAAAESVRAFLRRSE